MMLAKQALMIPLISPVACVLACGCACNPLGLNEWRIEFFHLLLQQPSNYGMVLSAESSLQSFFVVGGPAHSIRRKKQGGLVPATQCPYHVIRERLQDPCLDIGTAGLESREDIGAAVLELFQGLDFDPFTLEVAPHGGGVEAITFGDFRVGQSAFGLGEDTGAIGFQGFSGFAPVHLHGHGESCTAKVGECQGGCALHLSRDASEGVGLTLRRTAHKGEAEKLCALAASGPPEGQGLHSES